LKINSSRIDNRAATNLVNPAVREFDSGQGKVRESGKSQGKVGEDVFCLWCVTAIMMVTE